MKSIAGHVMSIRDRYIETTIVQDARFLRERSNVVEENRKIELSNEQRRNRLVRSALPGPQGACTQIWRLRGGRW